MLTTSHDPLQPLRVRLVEVLARCAELERQQPQRRRARRDPGAIVDTERLAWERADPTVDPTACATTQVMARMKEEERDPNFDRHWDIRKCPQCGKTFKVTPSNATKKVYCSAECSNAARQARHRAAQSA